MSVPPRDEPVRMDPYAPPAIRRADEALADATRKALVDWDLRLAERYRWRVARLYAEASK